MNYSVENISDFNERFYTISDNLTDISENINKNLEKLTKKSFMKKIIHKFFPQSSIVEIEVVYKELEEKEKILKKLSQVDKKLQNKNFLERAPKEVVEKEKRTYQELKERLVKIEKYIKELSGDDI